MKLHHLNLLVLVAALSGCESAGPDDIAMWNIFVQDRARIVYSAPDRVPQFEQDSASSLPLEFSSFETPDVETHSLPSIEQTPKLVAFTPSGDVDQSFDDLMKPTRLGLDAFTELGPIPVYPVIDIAEIRLAFHEGIPAN